MSTPTELKIELYIKGGVLDWGHIPDGIKLIVNEHDNHERFEITNKGTKHLEYIECKSCPRER